MPTLNEIRSTFLNYFGKQGHQIVPSSPLVPRNDPTLMFVNSGMVQFKNLFTGLESRDYTRAVSAQKCVRAGGKHNDLDNVGYTARHHTFFEMLGNFSFGDYFKQDAIAFAWELITQHFEIPQDRLYTTVYHTDDEAFSIWKKVGVPEDRIIRIASDDNFWRMGATGPCGPCTEIFYDHGDHIWGGPPGSPDEDGDRFIEIWNLVFMQNEQFGDGTMVPLEMQSIDTGMGLERIGALLQGSHDNYDTDTMRALIEASAQATSTQTDGAFNVHHRVIADHLRSTSFLIADGVMPSNDGRGYVLRRIMRRAMRHAHLLGAREPLMYRLVPALQQQMGTAYPELIQAQALITETLELEETRFMQTLERGLRLLDDEVANLPDGASLPGAAAFKLYDTYGFPLDLTQDALRERGHGVDTHGFDGAMAQQKARARAAWSGSGAAADSAIWFDLAQEHGTTDFLGYDTCTAQAQIIAVLKDGAPVSDAHEGDQVQIVTNQTPFYAEAGGQVGDQGQYSSNAASIAISGTHKAAGIFIHTGTLTRGTLAPGDAGILQVDEARRAQICANHSATHLLHEALRSTLGDHVAQRGSLNAPSHLRFDFSHARTLSPDELSQVELAVNQYIRQNADVTTRIMTPDDARAIGAQALFGEKYGDEVRVVSMGRNPGSGKGLNKDAYSIELCGGTHVAQTGQIGTFVILSESASSAGVRRIEALSGQAAIEHMRAQETALNQVASALKTQPGDAPARIQTLLDERKALQNEITQLKRSAALGGTGSDGPHSEDVAGVCFVGQVLDGVSGRDLPGLIDAHKERIGSGAIVIISQADGKVAVAAGVTKDKIQALSAVDMVRTAVAELGGKGGGGRPQMAQGGAKDASAAPAALIAVKNYIQTQALS